MPDLFKDFMAKIILPDTELSAVQGDVQGVIDEVNAKDAKIAELEARAQNAETKYNELRDRALDSLFNNKKGEPKPVEQEDQEDKPKKTFKDLVSADAPWKI